MTLNDLTAVCVDTRDPNLALLAAERMLAGGIGHVIMFTDEAGAAFIRPQNRQDVEFALIPTLANADDYSRFMLQGIQDFIKAEHFLVFQWDGFILNPALWWEGFLEYDYIGAPWAESDGHEALVGNGGFSLRTRRLFNALTMLDLPLGGGAEDRFIADHGRKLSEIGDVRIAVPEVARHFSVEHHPPYTMDARRLVARGPTFGFHGWFNFYLAFDDAGLIDYIDHKMTESQRRRVFTSWAHYYLLPYLQHAGRLDCLKEVLERTEAILGVPFDRSDPGYVRNVMEHIVTHYAAVT